MKTCRNCRIEKPFECYSPLKSGINGKNPWCKECRRVQSRKSRLENLEHFRAIDRARSIRDFDKRSASTREYYLKNKTRLIENEKLRYAAKRLEILAYKSAWRSENKDKTYVLNGQRRAAERRAMLPNANRKVMAAMYAEARRLTKETGIVHHVDHIHPLLHPLLCGLHVEWNMQIITASENMAKSNSCPVL